MSFRAFLVTIGAVFGIMVGIGAFCRFEYGNPEKTCTLCHEIRGARERWAKSPHKDVNCKDCHGGTLEALSDNVKRGVKHLRGADYAKLESTFCLSEKQVEEICARCAKCHRAEAEQWAKSGHGKSASVFLQDEKHNAAWKPADNCLRCHGMFLEGDMSCIAGRNDLASRRAIPCIACHRLHAEKPLQLFSRNEWTSLSAADLMLQKIVTPGGHPVKRSPDAQNRLCASCHAANAEGIAGSSDDRTPLGAQEGMSCTDCHKGHGMKADVSRGRCPHPQSASSVVQPFLAQAGGRPPCVVNGDNDHYFKACCMKDFVPVEERVSSEAGAKKYIDALAAGGRVTHLFACAVGQRADYDSKTCDPIWLAIDEAKARGEEPDEWPVNAKRMHEAGFDCFKVWCEYGRSKGLSVWISQRMNDVHHVDRPWNIRTNRFWYEHPELHRSPDHDRTKGGSWTLHALDYSKPAVQEFEFGIFKELVDRYDAEGFELDFMRFWEHLTPGKEREQAPILTAFIKRCRDYANSVAAGRGHPILLSVRVPSSYAAALAFGFDPEEWARQGLVDMIAVANFWAAADYDFDFAGWKAKITAANPAVDVLPCVCDNVSCGATPPGGTDLPALRGWADNALAAGADGLYFFNVAYMSTAVQRAIYGDGFSAEAIRAAERRHLPRYHDCTPKGVDNGVRLPVNCKDGGTVEIVVGHADGRAAEVVVALDADADAPVLTLNGAKPCGAAVRQSRLAGSRWLPKAIWRIPFAAGVTADGRNVIAFASVQGVPGRIMWCEIFLKGE